MIRRYYTTYQCNQHLQVIQRNISSYTGYVNGMGTANIVKYNLIAKNKRNDIFTHFIWKPAPQCCILLIPFLYDSYWWDNKLGLHTHEVVLTKKRNVVYL